MKFKEYVANLVEMLEKNPKYADMETVYAADDEGNGFQVVGYEGTPGNFDGEYNGDFTPQDNFEEDHPDMAVNAICIN